MKDLSDASSRFGCVRLRGLELRETRQKTGEKRQKQGNATRFEQDKKKDTHTKDNTNRKETDKDTHPKIPFIELLLHTITSNCRWNKYIRNVQCCRQFDVV
jgi:hypothetical protein